MESIAHAYYLLKVSQISFIVSNVELSVSMIICNFMVLAAAAHRLRNKHHSAPQKLEKEATATTMVFEAGAIPETSTSGVGTSSKSNTSNGIVHSSVEPRILELGEHRQPSTPFNLNRLPTS